MPRVLLVYSLVPVYFLGSFPSFFFLYSKFITSSAVISGVALPAPSFVVVWKGVSDALVRLLALRLPSLGWVFLAFSLPLGYGKTGSKNAQLVLQHCCKTSWIATLRVLQPTNQTCLAINRVVSGCEKVSCRKQRLVLLYNKTCTWCVFNRLKSRCL